MTITTDTVLVNRPLVEQIITQLIDHPEQHDQAEYGLITACGTQHCIGGWAVVLSGYEPDWTYLEEDELEAMWAERGVTAVASYASDPTLGGGSIDKLAQKLLGLTDTQAAGLFYDFGDTEHMVGRLKDLLNEAAA